MTVLGQLGIGCYTIVVASVLSVLEVSCNSSGIFKYFQEERGTEQFRLLEGKTEIDRPYSFAQAGENRRKRVLADTHNQAKIFALAIP